MAKESKSESASENLGLSEQSKFDASKPLRAETNEESQRPKATTESMKTDRGSFKFKG